MALNDRLAEELIRRHPGRAAAVLEQLGAREAGQILAGAAVRDATTLLERLSPRLAVEVLGVIGDERATAVLSRLPLSAASRLARRLPEDRVGALLDRLPPRTARGVRSLIRFPEDSAGALMDANALALPETFSVREALGRVRDSPEHAGENVFVLDSDQKLIGVLEPRELLLAKPREKLCDRMIREPFFLEATANRAVVLSHPGWRLATSLPVVDTDGSFLGAIGYRTQRELEAHARSERGRDADAPQALGELFAAGAGGLFDALTAARSGRGEKT